MGWALYVARRSLAFNHFAATPYYIELELTEFRATGADLKKSQKSISGVVESQYYGRERLYHVMLSPVKDTESDLIREFLDSTADGQQFNFDPGGNSGSPSRRAMLVVRDDEGMTEEPFGHGGDSEGLVQFSFSVRQV